MQELGRRAGEIALGQIRLARIRVFRITKLKTRPHGHRKSRLSDLDGILKRNVASSLNINGDLEQVEKVLHVLGMGMLM